MVVCWLKYLKHFKWSMSIFKFAYLTMGLSRTVWWSKLRTKNVNIVTVWLFEYLQKYYNKTVPNVTCNHYNHNHVISLCGKNTAVMRVWARAGDWGPRYTTAVCHHHHTTLQGTPSHALPRTGTDSTTTIHSIYCRHVATMTFACAGPNQYLQETLLLSWESVGPFWLVYM